MCRVQLELDAENGSVNWIIAFVHCSVSERLKPLQICVMSSFHHYPNHNLSFTRWLFLAAFSAFGWGRSIWRALEAFGLRVCRLHGREMLLACELNANEDYTYLSVVILSNKQNQHVQAEREEKEKNMQIDWVRIFPQEDTEGKIRQ